MRKPNTVGLGEYEIEDLIAEINERNRVTRFEVVDHRECVWCRGRLTANYLQKNGDYKEMPCDKCNGSGIMGGRVYSVYDASYELSPQDDGKTLKIFVSDK